MSETNIRLTSIASIAAAHAAESRLVFLPTTAATPEGNVIFWYASPHRVYAIRYGTSLFTGITNTLVEGIRPADYGPASYTDSVNQAEQSLYYRIKVDLP